MLEIKPPSPVPETKDPKIFLAGSIEMNTAEKWQEKVARFFNSKKVLLMNPRRDHWDNSWTQSMAHPQFREQVEWELDALEKSDYILMYFDPATKSPVTLLELGIYAKSKKIFVCCPEGFWRKGNVDIVCERYGIPRFESLDALLSHIAGLIA
jgi:hypothetical protein